MPTHETDSRLRIPALLEHRAQAARRRAEAFCAAPEYVLGIEVRPLTAATFSMLVATENRFALGGEIRESDIRNYLWFHSPLYAHCGVRTWRLRKRWALRRFNMRCTQPWCRWLGLKPSMSFYAATLFLAAADIRRLIDEAFADAAPVSGNFSAPTSATLEGQLIHLFSQHYHWPVEQIRHTPLRHVFQLLRCLRAASGETIRDTTEENLLADHLLARNAALAAARQAKTA